MDRKSFTLRPLTECDIDQLLEYYRAEGGVPLAQKWALALEAALRHIGTYPGTGSPRYGIQLNLPGLRFWPVNCFPNLIFYREHEGALDVWRVLHGSRDIAQWLSETSDPTLS